MKSGWLYTQMYWTTCIQAVWRGPSMIKKNLDLSLEQGIRRAQWFTLWSILILLVGLLVQYPALPQGQLQPSMVQNKPFGIASILAWLLLFVLAVPISYGLLRLYTLVNHIMVVNVFQSRGQRLRLLNVETTLITLSPVAAIALAAGRFSQTAEIVLMGFVLAYVLSLLGYSFNLVFHKRGIHGLLLVIESYLVTWFVLIMAGLATAVAVAVVAFLALAVLRLFSHRTS